MASETTTASEHADEGGVAGIATSFGLRGDLFAAQLVNFLIVLVVLWWFALRPIMRKLEEREKLVKKSVDDAKSIDARLQEITAEREQTLNAARSEARQLVEKSLGDSELRKAEMIEAARREVERVVAQGKVQLDEERASMMMQLRRDVVDLAVRAATKIVTEGLTEQKSKSLAEEVVRKLT